MNDGFAAFGSVIGIILFMILIFAGAYYFSKFMGKHYSAQASSSREMRVVDNLALDRDHYLMLVETGQKVLLIGVSPQHMAALAEIDGEGFAGISPELEKPDFFSVLKNRINKTEDHDR